MTRPANAVPTPLGTLVEAAAPAVAPLSIVTPPRLFAGSSNADPNRESIGADGVGMVGGDRLALSLDARSVTVTELERRVRQKATWLRGDAGIPAGGSIAVLADNCIEAIEVLIAGLIGSIWVVPVNTQLTPQEAAYVVGDARCRLILADDKHATLARNIASVRGIAHLGLTALHEHSDAIAPAPLDMDAPPGGRMVYTSGTTGFPKGVRRHNPPTVGDALTAQRASGLALGLDGVGTHLMTGPWYHAAVSGYGLFDLLNGAHVHILRRFDATSALAAIDRLQVTHTHMVPTMFERLVRLPDEVKGAFDGGSLRLVLHGAAPIRPETKAAILDWFGPDVVVEYWGSSEVGTVSLISGADWLQHPGSVGRPIDGWSVTVRDEAGTMVADGTVGTLFCEHRSGVRRFAYHGDDAKTDAAHIDAKFTPGDVGWVDDGYIYLAGRASNMIISGGVNIYPAEVEAVLTRHPAVLDAAVFGVPDDEWGERVHAVISLTLADRSARTDLSDELIEFCRLYLARYKCPRSIDIVGSLPRRDDGKLAIRTLRDPYWADRQRKI